jgi:hydrogenase expression/formation protein HypE
MTKQPTGGHERITLGHGGGGKLSQELVSGLLADLLPEAEARALNDAAVLSVDGPVAFTTDSFTVAPRQFPGGDIGCLAVFGTVNDLAMRGARPDWMSLALVIEEGLAWEELEAVVSSIKAACEVAGVQIVTGDTKVVERGAADGLYVNTTGLGRVHPRARVAGDGARPGDAVLISGTLADHGIAVLAAREQLAIGGDLESDTAPLWGLVASLLEAVGDQAHALRDPTRGGLASALNELALHSEVAIEVEEERLPIRGPVRGACELLGLDPLLVANEGKLVALVAPEAATAAVEAMRSCKHGKEAVLVGHVTEGPPGRVVLKTALGTRRVVDLPSGEVLPRIC